MRRAAKIDGNHNAIVAALRACGCTVQSLAAVGKGCPDLLVGTRGVNLLMEVKDPQKPKSARVLTSQQQQWHRLWLGCAHVVESAEQALAIVHEHRRAA